MIFENTAHRKQNAKSNVEQESDEQHKPVVDYVFVLETTKVRYVFLEKHKYKGKREEDRSNLALEKSFDGIGEKKKSEDQRKDRDIAHSAEQGGNDSDDIEYDQNCGKKKSETPKKFFCFHI